MAAGAAAGAAATLLPSAVGESQQHNMLSRLPLLPILAAASSARSSHSSGLIIMVVLLPLLLELQRELLLELLPSPDLIIDSFPDS